MSTSSRANKIRPYVDELAIILDVEHAFRRGGIECTVSNDVRFGDNGMVTVWVEVPELPGTKTKKSNFRNYSIGLLVAREKPSLSL